MTLLRHVQRTGGTAEEIEEERLDLVVGVMREEEPGALTVARGLREKSVAGLAARGFDGLPPSPGAARDILPSDDRFKPAIPGEFCHEARVLRAFRSQRVVEVTHDQVLETCGEQLVQQGHGVTPAGDADQAALVRGESGIHQPMRSTPNKPRKGSGTLTVPSACW